MYENIRRENELASLLARLISRVRKCAGCTRRDGSIFNAAGDIVGGECDCRQIAFGITDALKGRDDGYAYERFSEWWAELNLAERVTEKTGEDT